MKRKCREDVTKVHKPVTISLKGEITLRTETMTLPIMHFFWFYDHYQMNNQQSTLNVTIWPVINKYIVVHEGRKRAPFPCEGGSGVINSFNCKINIFAIQCLGLKDIDHKCILFIILIKRTVL